MTPDIYFKVTYPINEPNRFRIETNAKTELVGELLGEFIRGQIGMGVDESEANQIDVYEIVLGLDLSNDSWGTKQNCGNKGLRDGILIDVMHRIQESQNLDWLSKLTKIPELRWQEIGF